MESATFPTILVIIGPISAFLYLIIRDRIIQHRDRKARIRRRILSAVAV